jgi:NAD(P)-dependent dehydrogenase (short-subunit alcohol dehydrogenase family)
VRAVDARFGRIDVLVNNAGVAYSGPAEDETPEHVQDLVETNLTGLFALSRLVGRRMLAQGGGVVVNIASPSATVSLDRYGLAGYAATKAAVVALTRELAAQWGWAWGAGQRACTLLLPRRDHRLAAGPGPGRVDLRAHPARAATPIRGARRPAALPGQRRIQLRHAARPLRRRWLDLLLSDAAAGT